MSNPAQGERPLGTNEEPFDEANRRQAADSAADSIAEQGHWTGSADPYSDVPHIADVVMLDRRDLHEIQVKGELSKLLVREEARSRLQALKNASTLAAITPPVSLTDFLAIPDEDTKYRVDELFPVGGRIMLSAQFKAGKTTLVGNLIRSLVDGDPFLGKFATEPVGQVTLLDNELDQRTLRGWLRDQGIENVQAVKVLSMRGRVGSFNILDSDVRARWAEVLAGTNFLVLDVLRPVLDAIGLDENRDAGRFLVAFDSLLAEAGIDEAAVIHHMGHSGERARGDSRLQDWPDALWRLVRQNDEPNSARYFSAFGRDVDVAEGQLTYDVRNRNLTYATGSRKEAVDTVAEAAALPDILEFVGRNPYSSGRDIIAAVTKQGHPQKVARAALKGAASGGHVATCPGPRGATLHTLVEAGNSQKLDGNGFVLD
ncbi:AAA family ATPase [Rhodococcus daqingensis]|uniref:AAA family ATPase n=1 Tax=Rhodococcus daqingensis TaxID=2479363 RepID=A0ABW2RXU6_9NOCA